MQVQGNRILDASGEITSLAGNSLFWSNAGDTSDFYNSETVDFLASNWNSSLIRIAMGVKETWDGGTGYIDSPEAQETKIRRVIDAAIANGMYVIIDWHSHEAELYTAEAVDFFTRMAELYGNTPNVMYEIYNEPINQSWPVIKNYAEQVIAGIRSKDPDNLIIVGTGNYSQDVDVASRNPINDVNVAYTLHFYAAFAPHNSLRAKADTALNNNVALFVTEWGTILNTGEGAPDAANTAVWMDFLKERGISHANWSVSDKAFPETGSIVQGGNGISGLLNNTLTESGILVKDIIQNWENNTTVDPDEPVDTGNPETINCNTIDCIRNAMATAQAGDEIIVASGNYRFTNKITGAFNRNVYLHSTANGNSSSPIILKGESSTNPPVFEGINYVDGYLLSIEGDFWNISNLEFKTGSKGIVLDNSSNSILKNLTVHDIGEEGIHFRDGASNNLATECRVYNTGRNKPGFGEGFYVGSDKGQHDQYERACDNNTIENCIVGPNVAAEGVDVKEGTKNTIIRNNVFSAEGISGENSSDAFIDLKGAYGFVYNNTFNLDGSTIINTGVDFLDRGTDFNTGFRNAIFNNTFNLGSRASEISTARKKQGRPEQIHVWDNVRSPNSPDFPISDGTLNFVTESCPEWNILPCTPTTGETNQAPTVSFTAPNGNPTVTEGYALQIDVNASDADGTIANVKLYIDNVLVREETSAPYNWGHAESPNTQEVNGLIAGTYTFKAEATDNDGAISEVTFRLTVTAEEGDTGNDPVENDPTDNPCSFNTPSATSLVTFNRVRFSEIFLLGTGGPDVNKIRRFSINWNANAKALYQFAINTKDGVPEYYVDLMPDLTYQFANANPELTISNSGIANLDGSYWVTSNNDDFILVSKNRNFTLYFSNNNTEPSCNSNSGRLTLSKETGFDNESLDSNLVLFPNPTTDDTISISAKNQNLTAVQIFDLQGKLLVDHRDNRKLIKLNVSHLNAGTYIVKMTGVNSAKSTLFVKK